MRMIRAWLCLQLVLSVGVKAEEGLRDFYAEPGINPFKTSLGQDATENIDPFSGNIHLSYTDLSVPGNGGMDIQVKRFYNTPQSLPAYTNPFGYGWTMHFGRITISPDVSGQLCGPGPIAFGNTRNNPSIEFPDGGRELLVHSSTLGDGTLISKSNWKAECVDNQNPNAGMEVTAPDGTTYYMRELVFMQGEDGGQGQPAAFVKTWFTDRIVDTYGNSLDFTYLQTATQMKLLTRIDASDGRVITFSYVDESDQPVSGESINARLDEISANGQVWKYHYATVGSPSSGWGYVHHYKLTRVERPDGSDWQYEYGSAPGTPAYDRLTSLTYPFGGEVHYTYQILQPYLPVPSLRIYAIDTKTQVNPGMATGTWTYEFNPGEVDFQTLGIQPLPENAGRKADKTVITSPVGEERIYYSGYWSSVGRSGTLWSIGQKLRHEYWAPEDGTGPLALVKEVGYQLGTRKISDEAYSRGIFGALIDDAVYVPVIESEITWTDGVATKIDYSDHDDFGNPGTIRAYSNFTSPGDRVTEFTYLNDTNDWYIGLATQEVVKDDATVIGTTSRSYNAQGRLSSETRFGVTTQYTYTGDGDVYQVTDARNHTTTYSNYFRGNARSVSYPDGNGVTRVINDTGTLASKTSGRGYTTAFTYDDLNRLTGIDYPRGSDVSIAWSAGSKTLTRGNFQEVISWDGFGREIQLVRTDLSTGGSYEKNYEYDALGRKIFESDPESVSGVAWEYDSLGRITKVTNQDGSFKKVIYDSPYEERHYDENNHETRYRYQLFGSPDNRYLRDIFSSEGVWTSVQYNVLGNVLSVFQGEEAPGSPGSYSGFTKTYAYTTNHYLESIDSPADIGLTTYGRDALGNMTSRQVGSSDVVYYMYDEMNRLESVDYPTSAIDTSYTYDADGNIVMVSNDHSTRTTYYDENGNLSGEDVEIGNNLYSLIYTLDSLDHVAQVTYPSGRTIDYLPDALGRPTQAAPYVDSVHYFPDGSLEQIDYANGVTTTYTRTQRHWIDTLIVSGDVSIESLDYGYDSAGNVTAINNVLSPSKSLAMSYDGLNRLLTASGSWGGSTFAYDAYNNIVEKTDPTHNNRTLYYQYYGMLLDEVTYSDNSLQRVFSYDDYGNMIESVDRYAVPPYTEYVDRQNFFNEAGHLYFSARVTHDSYGTTQPLMSGAFSAEYDADGNRVRKINHSDDDKVSEFLYTGAGLLAGEYDESGVQYGHEYFYLGTMQIASAKENMPPTVALPTSIDVVLGEQAVITAIDDDLDGTIDLRDWTQTGGPTISSASFSQATLSFDTAGLSVGQHIHLIYYVKDDYGDSTQVSVSVNIIAPPDTPPIAEAGPDLFGIDGEVIQLDGSASSDVDGEITYSWTGDYLSDPDAVDPTVQASASEENVTKIYELTVYDSLAQEASDTVSVTWYSMASDTDSDSMPDAWEYTHFGDNTTGDAGADTDADGVSNLEEFQGGTDPRLPSPANLYTVKAGDSLNRVLWTRNPQATFYRVVGSTDGMSDPGAWPILSETTERYYLHNALTNGTTYYYRVEAYDASGLLETSDVLDATPAKLTFAPPKPLPLGLTVADLPYTIIKSNRFGDKVVVAELIEEGVANLYVWQYSVFSGWSEPELVHADTVRSPSFDVAIDNDRNILVAWIRDDNHGYDGFKAGVSRYRPFQQPFQSEVIIDDDAAQVHGNFPFREIAHLQFDDTGKAHACWRQEQNVTMGGPIVGKSQSYYSSFTPQTAWASEKKLEQNEDYGETTRLYCDVSPSGNVVAGWSRRTVHPPSYDPIYARTFDTWLSVYTPGSGWSDPRTAELLQYGIEQTPATEQDTGIKAVAVSDAGEAHALWYNYADSSLDNLVYDFSGSTWVTQSPVGWSIGGSRVANEEVLAIDEAGTVLLAWGDVYTKRAVGASNWSESQSLAEAINAPVYEKLAALDSQGHLLHTNADAGGGPLTLRIGETLSPVDSSWPRVIVDDTVSSFTKNPLRIESALGNANTVFWGTDTGDILVSEQTAAGPVPVAEVLQQVQPGSQVVLDGSQSYVVGGSIASYQWQQQVSAPDFTTAVTLADDDSATATFTASAGENNFWFTLTVTDANGLSESLDVYVVATDLAGNQPPVADAGSDIFALAGTTVQLDGSGSTDAESGLSYLWQGTDIGDPTAVAPYVNTVVSGVNDVRQYTLTVTDSAQQSDADTVTVTLYAMHDDSDGDSLGDGWEFIHFGDITSYTGSDDPDGDGVNNADEYSQSSNPGNQWPGLTVTSPSDGATVGVGQNVTFSGNASDTEDGDLTGAISWSSDLDGALGTGGSVTVSSLSLGTHTITASAVDSGGEVASVSITVFVGDSPPVADAGADISGVAGMTIQLDGSGSSDSEGALTYLWQGTDLSDPAVVNPTVVTTEMGTNYTLQYTLTVTDSGQQTDQDSVTVTLYSLFADSDSDGLSDGWEFFVFGDITLYTGMDDPDGDGVTNMMEFAQGSNPNNQWPTLTITAPTGAITITQGTVLTLSATASDTEDGDLSAEVWWDSDLDYYLGEGSSINVSTLSVGTHEIMAGVSDSGGDEVTATVTVTVEP